MTSNYFQQSRQAYTNSTGTTGTGGNLVMSRDPTANDVIYPIGQFWQNITNSSLWYLNSQSSTGGVLQSTWVNVSAAGDLSSLNVQTGTSPVVPNNGTITFNGATVAAGTHPVRTDGTNANTLAIEVQFSQAIASTSATAVGLAAFNSDDFSVDANGFVSITNPGEGLQFTADAGTAEPSSGNINVFGTALQGIATSATGSTVTVTADNASSTQKGVASFNSSEFTVTTGAVASNPITLSDGNNITVTGSPVNLGGTATIAVTGTTNHAIQLGNSTGSLTSLSVLTNGQIPIGSTGADPVPANITSTSGSITITNGAGTISVDLTAPVKVQNGGTGDTSLDVYNVLIGAGVSPVEFADPTTFVTGNPLVSQGAGNNPVFANTATVNQISIINLPVNPDDGVNKTYADLIAAGFTFKSACVVATTGADLGGTYNNGASGVGATLTNAGAMAALIIDGVTLSVNDRVLVKDETNAAYNGIYSVTVEGDPSTDWVITRTTDFDTSGEIVQGALVPVLSGTVNAGTFWDQTETVTTVGTDPIEFSQFGIVGTQFLQVANNLSDVASAATSRANLGLTNVATQNVTQYYTLVGGAANAITSIAPSSAGDVYISGGAAANPSFVAPTAGAGITLTSNAATLEYALTVPVIVAYGGTGATSFTAHSLLVGEGTSAISALGVATNGQIPIGSTGADPVLSTIIGGTGISITNGAGSITIDSTVEPGFTWNVVIGTSDTLSANTGFIANNSGTVVLTLPSGSMVGDTYIVTGINNATGWKIAQNAGQTIYFGTSNTTTGTGGYLESTNTRDSVEIVCVIANTDFNVLSSIGNITVV